MASLLVRAAFGRLAAGPRPRIEVCVCVYSLVQASPISVPLGFRGALEPGFVNLLAANHEADSPPSAAPVSVARAPSHSSLLTGGE